MVPDKQAVPFTHISVTEKGYQTGGSLLSTLKFWDRDLQRRQVPFRNRSFGSRTATRAG